MIIAEQINESWVNRPIVHTAALMPLEEIANLIFDDKSKQADVTDGEYKYSCYEHKPLICKCCGAPINRETMTCEYCGVQYGKE